VLEPYLIKEEAIGEAAIVVIGRVAFIASHNSWKSFYEKRGTVVFVIPLDE
jgi:hypothetical protein